MATQALAVSGARVYIVSRTQEKLDALVKFHGQGIAGKIIPIIADVTQKSEISRLVKEIESREHCLCILINNAGISGNTQQTEAKTAEEMKNNLFNDESSTFEDWQSTYKDQSPTAIFLDYGIFTIVTECKRITAWLLWHCYQYLIYFWYRSVLATSL
jgi:NAD(P)-dependent dehydrogenase (short-subunit alcohol dehydrogenase family)